MILTYEHAVVLKNKKQEMVISVDYCPSDDSFDNVRVEIYQNGGLACEISDLLDKAEGEPLAAMIEAVDWREIYRNSGCFEPEEYEVSEGMMFREDMER